MDSIAQPVGPSDIVSHPLLTAREKLEMLHEMRAGISSVVEDIDGTPFLPEDVDEAIEQLNAEIEAGRNAGRVDRPS